MNAAPSSRPLVPELSLPVSTAVVTTYESTDHANVVLMDTAAVDSAGDVTMESALKQSDTTVTSMVTSIDDRGGLQGCDESKTHAAAPELGSNSDAAPPPDDLAADPRPATANGAHDADVETATGAESEDGEDESDSDRESIITMLTEEDTMCSSGARSLPVRA